MPRSSMSVSLIAASAHDVTGPNGAAGRGGLRPIDAACLSSAALAAATSIIASEAADRREKLKSLPALSLMTCSRPWPEPTSKLRCGNIGNGGRPIFRPRRARHKVEHAVIVARLGEVAHKALGLAQIHRLVVAVAGAGRRCADRAWPGLSDATVSTCWQLPHRPMRTDGPERIGVLDGQRSLATVVADADRRVDRPFLDRLRAGREHADRKFEVAVDDLARRPVPRRAVIEQPRARRKAEHRQDAAVGEPLAEAVLHQAGSMRGAR